MTRRISPFLALLALCTVAFGAESPDNQLTLPEAARRHLGEIAAKQEQMSRALALRSASPKSWAPVHIMRERTDLLKAGRGAEVEALETRCIEANNAFVDWECTEERMALTDEGRALYMHCLPADITGTNCEHGEVATSVFERYWRETYHEAEHKLYVMAAMILLTRFPDAHAVLTDLFEHPRPRRRG